MTEHKCKEEELPSMSLGDHLEELRARLILVVLGIVVGLVITLFFGTRLVSFLEVPYYHAMQKFNIENPFFTEPS